MAPLLTSLRLSALSAVAAALLLDSTLASNYTDRVLLDEDPEARHDTLPTPQVDPAERTSFSDNLDLYKHNPQKLCTPMHVLSDWDDTLKPSGGNSYLSRIKGGDTTKAAESGLYQGSCIVMGREACTCCVVRREDIFVSKYHVHQC